MIFTPLTILIRGGCAIVTLVLSILLLQYWWARTASGLWEPGANPPTAALVGALLFLADTFLGRFIGIRSLLRRGENEPKSAREGETRRITRPDGTELFVELYGPADGMPVVLSHGWGADGTEWHYLKAELADRFRLIIWDLPGSGQSSQPRNRNFSLEKVAQDLREVLQFAGGRPAVLLGHSIGGMIVLTYCKLFLRDLQAAVAGIVIVNAPDHNPFRSAYPARLWTAIEKPVLIPLCHLCVGLSPLIRLFALLAYSSGSLHWAIHRDMFAGNETRGQLDCVARFAIHASPAVIARGSLAMIRYDARSALPEILVPALVVACDRDITCYPEASRQLARELPNARLVELGPARHMGVFELHQQFAAELRRFLEPMLAGHASAGKHGPDAY